MNVEKWIWHTSGCKVSKSGLIVMKLKLHVPCQLLNLYDKFQTNISKHAE